MISSQRQHLILSRLRTRGAVRITALSKELGVSAMTIRRDIADLADKGLLKRVHGGAVSTSTLLSEPLFSVKSQMDIGLKDAIAQEAVKYVAPGDVIAIGGGTTAYVFAQHLLESQQSSGITILTNSIPVAELVQALESKDVEVIVTGGVTTRSNSLVGPIADKVVASLRVNTVFPGTHSVSIPRGFLMPNSLEAATDMAMMDIADRTIILTDHTKWSCTSLSLFARFDQWIRSSPMTDWTPIRCRKQGIWSKSSFWHAGPSRFRKVNNHMSDFVNYTRENMRRSISVSRRPRLPMAATSSISMTIRNTSPASRLAN